MRDTILRLWRLVSAASLTIRFRQAKATRARAQGNGLFPARILFMGAAIAWLDWGVQQDGAGVMYHQ